MKKLIIYILLLLALPTSLLAQMTVGTGGNYSTLSDAFTAINEGDLNGNVILQIISNITESGTCVLYQNGYNGTANYTSLTIYPTGSGYIIDGDIDGPLIDLNGASNVTIDGRVGTSGFAKDLVITNINTGTSASTIQFSESATTNTVKYCIIKGAETSASSGVIFFTTSSAGSGNDGNTIDNNDITFDAAGRPINAIYSNGTSGRENSGNTISNNNIYNFLKNGTASNGIFLSLNTTSCTISGNSFYETASFAPSASVTYYIIRIDNTSGTGFTVSGNFIGGRSASCGGSAWTKTNAFNNIFYGIFLNVGTGTPGSIQNNTIKNFSYSNNSSAAWTGIHIANGDVNIGTTAGNTIGATTGTGSVTVTGGASGTTVYGINIASGGTVDCRNNIIGSVTAANSNSTNATNLFVINKTGTSGTTTISNNTIGSTSTTNSINASSASTGAAQSVYGISNAGTGNITIGSNTIANLTNGTTNSTPGTAGLINGIKSIAGNNTVSDNIIHDLTSSSSNNSATNTASVCGIMLTGTTLKAISGNTIYNLSNTYASFAGSVIGLYFTGNTGANTVSGNFIHGLSVTGASSTSASVYGIQVADGATTYSNNIISLGGTTQTTIYGIYETGTAGNNNNLYFNSVYISGVPTAGALNSYTLYSAVTTNTRNFRNNILYNARSNSGATGKHYAIYLATATGATIDYNDYYTSGTDGMLGYLGGDIATLGAWQTATSQDVNSLATNPSFANAGGAAAADYLPTVALNGVTGTGILTDYNGATRSLTTPTMGVFEVGGSCINPTSGGTIAADQSGCSPFDPSPFTSTAPASGYSGSSLEYKWQKKVGAGSWDDISFSNSPTYDDPGPLTLTTLYKRLARVSCTSWATAAESNVLTVTVNPSPNTGLAVGGAGSVCSGSGTNITVALSETGVNYQLRDASNNPIGAAVPGNGGTISLPTGNLTTTTTFNVLATNASTSCSAQLTQTATETVNPLPNKSLAVGTTASPICSGTGTNITVALSETGINYQLRDASNNPVGAAVPGNGGTINLPTGNVPFNTTFNVLAINAATSCSVQLTQTRTITINPSPTPVITGAAAVCIGTTGSVYSTPFVAGDTYAWTVVGGTITAGAGTNSITVTWNVLGAGTVDVTETITATGCSASATQKAVTVNALPTPVITGAATVCNATTGSVYSSPFVAGHTYAWTVVGGTITAGAGTSSITVTWNVAGAGTVDVTETITATTCSSAATQKTVTVNALPTPVITGAAAVCNGTTGSVYSTPFVAGHTYSWTVVGGTITAGAGTSSITVTWNVAGAGTVDVTETITATTCSAAATQKTVTVNPLPTPVITGAAAVCIGTTGSVYNTPFVAGHTYAWTVVGGTITAGAGTSSITVTWNVAGAGTVDVTETITATTCSAAATQKTVTVNALPTPVITGAAAICNRTTGSVYSTPFVAGHTYAWIVVGGIITAGAGTNSITVTWNVAGAGTVDVTETITATTCSAAATQKTVTVNALPNTGLAVGGTGSVCSGTGTNITVALSETGVNYQLRNGVVNVGAAVAGNAGTINLPTGNLTATTTFNVLATNATTSCSAQLTQTATVSIDPTSVGGSIAGSTTVCTGTNSTTLTLSGHTGSVVKWQYSTDNWVTPVDIVNTTTTQTATNLSTTTKYRAVVQSGVCTLVNSAEASVTVSPASVGGSISGTSPVTYGSLTGTMTLTGYTGTIQRWEKRFNSGSWTIISNSNPTYSEIPGSAGTWGYRAVVKSGSCAEANSAEFSIIVSKAPLTVTAADKSKVYDGLIYSLFTVTYSGFVNSETSSVLGGSLTFSGTAATATSAGSYVITPGGLTSANYTITFVNGQLTINKAPLAVTAADKSKVYDGLIYSLFTVTYSGFVNSETSSVLGGSLTFSGTATTATSAGSYVITPGGPTSANYSITFVNGQLTINKAPLTVTAADKSKGYDGLVYGPFTVTYSGFVNSETSSVLGGSLTISGTAATAINAGSYVITPGGLTSVNYTFTYVNGQLTINKVNLTFTADSKSRAYLAQNPVLTYFVSGYVNAETQSVLDVLPSIQTTAVQNSPVGNYPITISGGSDNNYSYLYVPGTLSISKIAQIITFTDVPEKLLVADTYTLVATSTSGLIILFESIDTKLATVSGDQLTGVSKGNVQIRASNPGNQNYNTAEAFATVEIYSTHKDIMHLFTPNNDGFNDYWELPELATWGKCDVKVYNRWGKLVFADANYNNLWDGTSNGAPLPEGPYYFIIKTENTGTVKGTVNIVR